MMVRGRTVALLLILTMLVTSFFTLIVVQGNGLIGILEQNLKDKEDRTNISDNPNDDSAEMKRLIEAYERIKISFIDEKSDSELIDGAIHGMVEALNDRHSAFMDAKQAEDFFSSLSDSFEGIGAEVTMENGKLTVVSPIKDSPSEKAGIQPRDQIISINGESLEGLSLFEAVSKIRGKKGTKAELEVIRTGYSEPIKIIVIRDTIPIETVDYELISTRKGNIGKIIISNFGESTSNEFKTAIRELEKNDIKGLIIDLRGNPGGYLQSVVDIGDLVIPNKGIIVQIEGKSEKTQVYRSNLEKAKYPIVSIIDGGSASASEILSAALQEAGKYPVVGESSYGKGTVQNPFELSDGSNLKLTIAKWLTPAGNWIHQKGVQPDIKVSQPSYYSVLPFPENVDLKYDMNNNHVKNLQTILNGLGYKTLRIDGYFDESTQKSLRLFQKTNQLEVTGIVDNKTALKLQEEIIKRIRDPKSDTQLQVAEEALLKLIK